jgi:hypothetical protein
LTHYSVPSGSPDAPLGFAGASCPDDKRELKSGVRMRIYLPDGVDSRPASRRGKKA